MWQDAKKRLVLLEIDYPVVHSKARHCVEKTNEFSENKCDPRIWVLAHIAACIIHKAYSDQATFEKLFFIKYNLHWA